MVRFAVLAAALSVIAAVTLLEPQRYVATGGVLLADGMLKARYTAADPQTAAAAVRAFIGSHPDALLVDPPLVVRQASGLATGVAVIAVVLLLGLLFVRKAPALRSEKELNNVLGVPMLAARPLAPEHLARQLLAHWFGRGRPVLAVVSAEEGDDGARAAAELARACAASGAPTLLIDADLRSPRLHRAFALPNRAGLADFLQGRRADLARAADNLTVLVSGRTLADPLELLSRSRMIELLRAAASRYSVVLVHTPAAARGPDLQLFAAFAGGVLVVTKKPCEPTGLAKLRALLDTSKARVVGAVLTSA